MKANLTVVWLLLLFVVSQQFGVNNARISQYEWRDGLPSKIYETNYLVSLTSFDVLIRLPVVDSIYPDEPIRVVVMTDGFYTFEYSDDQISDLSLYEYQVEPYSSKPYLIGTSTAKLLANVYLRANFDYYLDVTRIPMNTMNAMNLVVTGENYVNLFGTQIGDPISFKYYSFGIDAFQQFTRFDATDGSYYYELFTIEFNVSGLYAFRSNSTYDNYGYLYHTQFNPSSPTENLVDSNDDYGNDPNFLIVADLTFGETYYLVCTWWAPDVFDPTHSLIVSGPAPVTLSSQTGQESSSIESQYSVSLTADKPIFSRYLGSQSNNHYELLKISFSTSGNYAVMSNNNNTGMFAYLYSNTFDPLKPEQNLLNYGGTKTKDGLLQFTIVLSSNIKYYLVVTTDLLEIETNMTIMMTGPSTVTFEAITTYPKQLETIYTSTWVENGPSFSPMNMSTSNNYYESVRVTVLVDGSYTFKSTDNMNTTAFLYIHSFDPSFPENNLITYDNKSSNRNQYEFTVYLYAYNRYSLVVTLIDRYELNTFGISVIGDHYVNLNGNQAGWPLSSMLDFPVDVDLKQFHRPEKQTELYYYRLIEIKVSEDGEYTFRAQGNIDNYGYLYIDQFEEALPDQNLVVSNDDYGTDPNFSFTEMLLATNTYYLVFTWKNPGLYDKSDNVIVSGPAQIRLTLIDGNSLISSDYSIFLTDESPVFIRHLSTFPDFHYQLILLNVNTPGIYTFNCYSETNVYGYLYRAHFDPENPSSNLLMSDGGVLSSSSFKISAYLSAFNIYYLVVTTYLPNVTAVATLSVSGPRLIDFKLMFNFPSFFDTLYSASWSPRSPKFARLGETIPDYYYGTIQVVCMSNGIYTFRSTNDIDTFGFLYVHEFDSSAPSTNLVAQSEKTNDNPQFTLRYYLYTHTKYYLVVTTDLPNQLGIYNLIVTGQNYINMIGYQMSNPISMRYDALPDVILPTFSPSDRPVGNYHYQLFRVDVPEAGHYTFRAVGTMDSYAYFYDDQFQSSSPSENLITSNDDDGADPNFRFSVDLSDQISYYLAYTWREVETLDYLLGIIVSGPAEALLTPTTGESAINLEYASSLKAINPTFKRPYGSGTRFYYQLLQVIVSQLESYTVKTSSPIDTFCYLYENTFDPSSVNTNLLSFDDDSAGEEQCLLRRVLSPQKKYYVVITTYFPDIFGPLTIIMSSGNFLEMILLTSSIDIDTTYSSKLTEKNLQYRRYLATESNYYYELIQVTASVTDRYVFRSTVSNIKVVGCLYIDQFHPTSTTEYLIICDDQSGNKKGFLFTAYLDSSRTYFFVITTSSPNTIGSFTIITTGPAEIDLVPVKNAALTRTWYLSRLATGSLTFRPNSDSNLFYYYDLMRITTSLTTTYEFTMNASIDLVGSLYADQFIASDQSANRITYRDQSINRNQTKFSVTLLTDHVYYFVVTTVLPKQTCQFNLTISSSKAPNISQISRLNIFRATISSVFNQNSPSFFLNSTDDAGEYYYDLIQINVRTTGVYTFRIMNTTGIVPKYFIYKGTFDNQSISTNLLTYTTDDQLFDSDRIQITSSLESTVLYHLLITTNSPNTVGTADTIIYGPASVNTSRMSTSESTEKNSRLLKKRSSDSYEIETSLSTMSDTSALNWNWMNCSSIVDSVSLQRIVFNSRNSNSKSGYLHTITIQYAQGYFPRIETQIWIYSIIQMFDEYLIDQRFQIPSVQISTESSNQTYIVADHLIFVRFGSFIGVSSDDKRVRMVRAHSGDLVYIDYDDEREEWTAIAYDDTKKGINMNYTVVT